MSILDKMFELGLLDFLTGFSKLNEHVRLKRNINFRLSIDELYVVCKLYFYIAISGSKNS